MQLNLTIIGTGYVGLVSGVCLAELGHIVTCVDKDDTKIQNLKKGVLPIYEPGLDELVIRNVACGRLNFSTDLADSATDCDAIFIAVGTPTSADGISADLSAVHAVARAIAPHLNEYTVVITKSTVPVLTNQKVEEIILQTNPNANFDICSNPEFLREGNAIGDFMKPDRIVAGVRSDRAKSVIQNLYAPLTLQGYPLVITTPESAELIKYAANALLATKVAFINEIADLAEATDGNIADIAKAVGMDTRIGEKFLQAGPGFGGSCFPKDMYALKHMGRQHNAPNQIIEAVIQSNTARKNNMATRIIAAMDNTIANKKIAVLGVTFKANTDDMRDSVALDIIPQLVKAGANIAIYDPAGAAHGRALLPSAVTWEESAEKAYANADALVLLTDWPQFKTIDLAAAKAAMNGDVLLDLRNMFSIADAIAAGFTYHSIGRKVKAPEQTNEKALSKIA